MIKRILIFLIIFNITFPITSNAIGWKALFDAMTKIYGINLDMKNLDADQLSKLNDLADSLKGTHDYGGQYYNANDYGWGNGTSDWQSILSMARSGGGDGELGSAISQLSRQFPISGGLNSGNDVENTYYDLQARDALASRSSSELAYKRSVEAERTMKNLHDLIDKTKDSKSAQDLNNRFASESAMNNIQQTKLLSILVQQASLAEQVTHFTV